jgi:hypothetical protein
MNDSKMNQACCFAGNTVNRLLRAVGLRSWVALALLVSCAWLLAGTGGNSGSGADNVRWDIINADFTTSPPTLSAGGVASATADAHRMMTLTGSGTFVAPASGGISGAVTGGGTWETFLDGVSTGTGTYVVTKLASWQFSNFQTPNPNDLIDDGKATSGNTVLRIQYSDGSEGILGVGCSAGTPGIQEGVIATKGFVTYWSRVAPSPTVPGFTLFHVR